MRSLRWLTVGCGLALAVAWVTTARADGLIRDGIGAISGGRGGTNMGFADNGAVLLDNPGALVNVGGNGLLDLDVDTITSQVHYTDPKPNNVYSHVRPIPIPDVAYIKRSKDRRWAYGIGFFGPAGFGAAYDFQNSFAGPQLYKSFGAMGKLLPALSYRVTDRLSIGGTVGLATSYVNIQGPLFMQTGVLRGAPTIVDLTGLGVAPTGSIGVQYLMPNNRTILGLAYTTETQFKMDGMLNANVFGVGPGPVFSRFNTQTHLTWPRSLAAGFSHRINPRNIFAVDVIWYDWNHAFNQVAIDATNASNPLVPMLAGPAIVQNLPLNWRDTVSMRLGYQWMPDDINIFRFGYVYHASPVPNNTLTPFTDGVLLNTFSLGYSRRIGRAYFNAAYQYSFGNTRHVGVSSLAGGDFSNSTLQAQAHTAFLGILVPF
ncbi:MAG TPA: outer membrane protein transport protein [Pirellulales bacterium]|nr:outer membrane protein transport protein [Pirellulales bacterium]